METVGCPVGCLDKRRVSNTKSLFNLLTDGEPMAANRPLSYHSVGVLDNAQLALNALVNRVRQTGAFRSIANDFA